MTEHEAPDTEFDAGHQERLSNETLARIISLADEIIERFGVEKDSGLENVARELRPTFIKFYQKMGITEETPVVKQLTAELDDARALPVYLKTGQSPQAVVIIRPLIPQIRFKYKICYGERSNLDDRWFKEGIEIDILDDDPRNAVVFERDPSTHDYITKPMTQGRGRDVVLDLEEVLASHEQHS